MDTPKEIRERFLTSSENEYKKFSDRTVVPKEHRVIGIRMPVIKQFAKDIAKSEWRSYLNETDDEYHEDLLLRGFIVAYAKMNDDERFHLMREFIPKMDNWAVCDSFCMALKVTKKNADAFWEFALSCLNAKEEFRVRSAVVIMLAHFIDKEHINDIIGHMDSVKHDMYYVKMAVAWCIADCFIKFPKETMEYLKNNTLDKWTFNKALSKITDSFRVSSEDKEEIRKMRRN